MSAERQLARPGGTWELKDLSMNEFKTSDIRISKDSAGCFTARHKYQGTLIDGNYYNSRTECRREAVKVLQEIKEGTTNPAW